MESHELDSLEELFNFECEFDYASSSHDSWRAEEPAQSDILEDVYEQEWNHPGVGNQVAEASRERAASPDLGTGEIPGTMYRQGLVAARIRKFEQMARRNDRPRYDDNSLCPRDADERAEGGEARTPWR